MARHLLPRCPHSLNRFEFCMQYTSSAAPSSTAKFGSASSKDLRHHRRHETLAFKRFHLGAVLMRRGAAKHRGCSNSKILNPEFVQLHR